MSGVRRPGDGDITGVDDDAGSVGVATDVVVGRSGRPLRGRSGWLGVLRAFADQANASFSSALRLLPTPVQRLSSKMIFWTSSTDGMCISCDRGW